VLLPVSIVTASGSQALTETAIKQCVNALAPGSARLFSAAAAAGENSFKARRRANRKNQIMLYGYYQINKKDNSATWALSPVKYRLLTEKMPAEVTTTHDKALKYSKEMALMRRIA
jgi:hypothetical protein